MCSRKQSLIVYTKYRLHKFKLRSYFHDSAFYLTCEKLKSFILPVFQLLFSTCQSKVWISINIVTEITVALFTLNNKVLAAWNIRRIPSRSKQLLIIEEFSQRWNQVNGIRNNVCGWRMNPKTFSFPIKHSDLYMLLYISMPDEQMINDRSEAGNRTEINDYWRCKM